MNEREKIFARIQEALRLQAPRPDHAHATATSPANNGSPASRAREWLPLVGETFEARLALFRQNAAALRAGFQLVANRQELAGHLLAIRDSEKWTKIATHAGELTDFAAGSLGLPVCRVDQGYEVNDLESCSVGITECDALVAQTGSVLVASRSAGGRALSVLPPHHVVLARRDQLLGDLPDAFALLKQKYAPSYPSFISFITGPSRTGDIERILVLGAHGPKKLTILCVM
jgi:L-lactate dehydrogenase complex protein LldG